MSRHKHKPAKAKSKAEERRKKQPQERMLPKEEVSAGNVILRPGSCLARLNGQLRGF